MQTELPRINRITEAIAPGTAPAERLNAVAAKAPPLADETRELVPTEVAAYHLCRQPQTLREWACLDRGLLRPVRIGNRLGWRTADIRRLLGMAE